MIIKDIPQTGKLGQTVTWPGRNGPIRWNLVTPKNPRTDCQMIIRDNLAQQAHRYDLLAQAQQDAWCTAAAYQSAPRLGQSGPLTGLQLFTKVNCTLTLFGHGPRPVPQIGPVLRRGTPPPRHCPLPRRQRRPGVPARQAEKGNQLTHPTSPLSLRRSWNRHGRCAGAHRRWRGGLTRGGAGRMADALFTWRARWRWCTWGDLSSRRRPARCR
jgi:hypothetical protein